MRLLAVLIVSILVGVDFALNTAEPIVTATVSCETTKGPLVLDIYRDWSPIGTDRFMELVHDNFFTNIALFRCVEHFLTQFGISDIPEKKHWHRKEIPDDPNLNLGIKRGYLSFAGGGPNTRSTQLFIAFEDLDFLGNEPWETPFGKVVEGYETLEKLYKGYGDIPPFGKGPDQQKIHNRGNSYIKENFPLTDFITSCKDITPVKQLELVDVAKENDDGAENKEDIAARVIKEEEEEMDRRINVVSFKQPPPKKAKQMYASGSLKVGISQRHIFIIIAGILALLVGLIVHCSTADLKSPDGLEGSKRV